MLDSFTNDPLIFRYLIFPSFDWKDLIAPKWKFTLASEIYFVCVLTGAVRLDSNGAMCASYPILFFMKEGCVPNGKKVVPAGANVLS